jgi:hypothetical protein
MYVIGHEAVGIYMEVRRDMFAIVIYRIYEVLKTDEKLLIILLLFKDILSVDATKHHMVDTCA